MRVSVVIVARSSLPSWPRAYAKGASVRELAEVHGRSYGFVHNPLSEAEAPMRRCGRNTLPRKTTPM